MLTLPTPRAFPRLALILFLSASVVACDSDSGGNDVSGENDLSSGTVRAVAGGNAFDATTIIAQFENGVLAIGGNLGASQAGEQEQINLTLANASTGSHSFGIGGASGVYSKGSISSLQAYAALSGTLNVTTLNDSGAAGTFSFTGRANDGTQIQISDGEFDVTY